MTLVSDLIAARALPETVDDPFASGLFGGLPKMATSASETSTAATTVLGSRNGQATSSSDPETKSFSDQLRAMPLSSGANQGTDETSRPASSVPSSETKARTYRRSLSDRLTPSLISAGLVRGITPSSTRKQSGQPILVLALDTPVGSDAGRRLPVSSSSNVGEPHA